MNWTIPKNAGLLFVTCLIAAARPAAAVPVAEIHYVMGTYFSITTDGLAESQARPLMRRCFNEARRLEAVFSRYDAASELSQLNARADHGPVDVSADLADLLARSLRLQAATGGRFDVTIGALTAIRGEAGIDETDLRGSRRLESSIDKSEDALRRVEGKPKQSFEIGPPAEPVEASVWATASRGQKRARLVADHRLILVPGVQLDFDGIAKGYTVDHCAALLREAGVRRALLSLGESSQYAIGAPLGAPAWTVMVRGLRGNRAVGFLALRDQALSVSSAFTPQGHIAHIIDPRTGRRVREPSIAAVVMASATDAEAWSKALLIDRTAAPIHSDDSPAALRITRRSIERLGTITFTAFASPRAISPDAEPLL